MATCIGAGGNTKLHHIPKLQAIPGVEVVAIANRTAESAAKAGEPFGITKVHYACTESLKQHARDFTQDSHVQPIIKCSMIVAVHLQATGNWRDIIDDTAIDAVVIGTWPYLHCTLVLEALRAGKHVLTEARLVSYSHRTCG